MKRVLTPEMEKYFVENAFSESEKSMARKFGVSNSVVKGVFKRHNIIVPKEVWIKFKIEAQKGRTTFSPEETKFIEENYMSIPIKTMAKILNRSDTGVKSRMRQLGLVIPPELADQRQRDGMFRQGKEPSNKGKKQAEYMSAEAIEKTKATRFKKGQLPHNTLPDGAEVERKDSRGRIYILVKVPGQRKLQLKQRVVWEQHYGKIPPAYNIIFKDNNTRNFAIENLECISNKELMKRNTLHNYPEEIRQLIQLKGAVNRQINKHKKQQL